MPKDELSLLRMATLKDICQEYGIDVSGRRKLKRHILRALFPLLTVVPAGRSVKLCKENPG